MAYLIIMLKNKLALLSITFVLISQILMAQGQGNSPYSVLGMGELSEPTAPAQDMMGGTGVSFSNAFYVNSINPALLVKNRVASGYKYVAFNVGFRGNLKTINTTNQAVRDFGMNMQSLSISSALTNNWATSIILSPYSIMDYHSVKTGPIEGQPEGTITYDNNYTGGINRISYINSFRAFKNLYLGLEGHYNFGSMLKDSTSYLFNDLTNQLRTSTRLNANGASVKIGAAYQQKLSEDWRFNVGASFEKSAKLKTQTLRTLGTFADVGNGAFLTRKPDTLANVSGTIQTPDQIRLGISFESPFHWVFAADYYQTNWDKARGFNKSEDSYFGTSKEYRFGIEYLPNSNSTKYFNQVFYRAGFSTGDSPYVIAGQRIKDSKVTMGISMPMGFRNPNYLNLGVALGNRGVTTNNLIKENYVRISVSFDLLSPWYIKPKID